jgi:predicted Ser/Thr protein kinase
MKIPKHFTHPVAIGRGSFSKVYRVYQPKLDRQAVLKVIPLQHATDAAGIEKEAHILASMRLPCVPHIYDIIRSRKQVVIVMEWVRGIPLSSLMGKPMTPDIAAAIASAVISAIALLHDNNIVHRDIKPQNILIAPDKVFLVDFGFSSLHPAVGSNTGVIQGSPAYMAPELWSCQNPIDYKRSDLYALGVVLRGLLGEDLPAFAAELTTTDPAGRPLDCIAFEKTWREFCPPMADASTLRASISTAVEEYIAHLLLSGARELNGKLRRDEAYALLTESLEAWPDNPEALDFLQTRFSAPLSAPRRNRLLLGCAVATAFAAACVAAYVLGIRSSSPREFPDATVTSRDEGNGRLSLLILPHHVRQTPSAPIVLRDGKAGMDITGKLIVMIPERAGSLLIDKTPVAHTSGESAVALLSAGMHRIEWFDSTEMRTYGETISLLPFETKTISFARFIHGT